MLRVLFMLGRNGRFDCLRDQEQLAEGRPDGDSGAVGYTGEQYYRSVIDQFELHADNAAHPRVMGIPLHPMITGQPLRIKYLQRAIAEIKQRERVWFGTGSEIIDAYQRACVA